MKEMTIYQYLKDFPYKLVYIKSPNKEMIKMSVENIELDNIKSFSSIKTYVDIIEDAVTLHFLYNKTNNESIKQYIKRSKNWKDEANLVIEVINE